MIILLGTSHISPESIKKIKKIIKEEKPDCVAVELDMSRYQSMLSKKSGSPPGLFLKILSWVQKRLGKMTGIFPGQEMFEAVNLSRKSGIPVYLIDQNFQVTAQDIQNISTWEKIKLLVLTFFAFSEEKLDLKDVPPEKIIKEAIHYMRKNFPEIYKVLVVKRNEYMAEVIQELKKRYKNILVVVGAGHIEGLKKLLKDKNLKTIS